MNVFEQECDSQELEYWHDLDDYEVLDEQWKEKYLKARRELEALQDKLGMIKNIMEGIPNYRAPLLDPRAEAMRQMQGGLSGYQGSNLAGAAFDNLFGGLFR